MTIQRAIAVVMILGSSVLTAWVSGDIAFPAILGMLGLLGVQRRFTWDIRPEKHFITPLLLLLLAVLFALHCRYAHVRADQAAAFAWQTIARYFLASMILILFLRPHRTEDGGPKTEDRRQRADDGAVLLSLSSGLRPPSSGLPPALGLFHLASVLAAGQVLLLDDRYVAFRLAELLSVTLVILYAAVASSAVGSRRSAGWGLTARVRCDEKSGTDYGLLACLAALLLVAINLGWIAGSLLYRRVEVINFLPAWLSHGSIPIDSTTAGTARVGFSASGELSTILSIKEDADTTPVLSITGSNPAYLRAKAFETYHQSTWHELSSWEGVAPEQNLPLGMLLGRTSLFRLHEAEAAREMTIRHEASLGDVMFTPAGACFVEAPFVVMRNDDEIVRSQNVRSHQSYRVGYAAAASRRSPTGLQLYHLTELPKSLDPQVRKKASRIFQGCTTTAQKIDAVTKYFHTNYAYVLGLEVPAEQDPLNYFLLQASTGYCEYFASGAAILLRLANVPTRYVTGFLVTERGSDRGSWSARNMDAHAWAEAWDKEHGQWVVVEATTQEGLDDVSLADELVRNAGGGRPFLTQLVQSLYEYGLFGVVGQFFASYGLLTGMGLSLVFLGAAGWIAARRRRHASSVLRLPSAEVLAWRRLLAAVDGKARALGYRRCGDETLHAFAARLATAPQAVSGQEESQVSRTSLRAPRSNLLPLGLRLLRRCAARNDMLPTCNLLSDWYFRYAELRYRRAVDPGAVRAKLASLWVQARGAGAKPGRIERLRQIVRKRS
jgi:hypothetical protein